MNDYIKISGIKFPTLLALTNQEQELGLMYRKPPTPVMSFIYSSPRINKFWMKSTPSPLDIVFCNKNKILSIHCGEPNSTRIIGDDIPSDLVVELPAGTCISNNIKIGNEIEYNFSEKSLMRILMLKNGLIF
jgi:uncharacterized protein